MRTNTDHILEQAIEHHRAGRLAEAENAYRVVLQQNANHVVALQNLGLIAYRVGKHSIAIELLKRAVDLDQANPVSHKNLGAALRADGKLDEAVASYERAITLSRNDPQTYTNLGNALRDLGKPNEALAALRRAVAIDPNYAIGFNNLGGGLSDLGDFPGAISAFNRAIELQPDLAGAHFNLALVLLQMNDPRAWQEYEWRWKFEGFSTKPRNFPQPRWAGEELTGKTILLHAEQGLGDTIQFIRYVPHVAAQSGKVIVECQAPLKSLIEQMPDVSQMIETGQPLPAFDVHCPLLSLPLVCGLIPAKVPYLWPSAEMVSQWKSIFAEPDSKRRVGLCWAGSPTQVADKRRSMRLDQFAPLGKVEGIRFHSLQKGDTARQADHAPAGMELVDHSDKLTTMADTAALISQLDLVITIDTSVAHLAGAMGKRVWVLLAFVPAWQWLMDRDDSLWYPTAELFRQPAIGDWDSVIERVTGRLEREFGSINESGQSDRAL